jgi:hypothetical protein
LRIDYGRRQISRIRGWSVEDIAAELPAAPGYYSFIEEDSFARPVIVATGIQSAIRKSAIPRLHFLTPLSLPADWRPSPNPLPSHEPFWTTRRRSLGHIDQQCRGRPDSRCANPHRSHPESSLREWPLGSAGAIDRVRAGFPSAVMARSWRQSSRERESDSAGARIGKDSATRAAVRDRFEQHCGGYRASDARRRRSLDPRWTDAACERDRGSVVGVVEFEFLQTVGIWRPKRRLTGSPAAPFWRGNRVHGNEKKPLHEKRRRCIPYSQSKFFCFAFPLEKTLRLALSNA